MAAYLWVARENWIWKGQQPFIVKIFAFVLILINLIQGAFVRIAGPATMTLLMYNSVLAIPALLSPTTNSNLHQENSMATVIVTVAYLAFYAIFMIAHTPRAVPIKDTSGKTTEKWRNNRKSAYRPLLFALSFLISGLQIVLVAIVTILTFLRLGWYGSPPVLCLFVFVGPLPYVTALLDGIFSSKRPNIDSFLSMIHATPAFILTSIWFFAWLPSYASARVSDLSWGNRESSSEETDARMAIRRAKTGWFITYLLVCSNLFLSISFIVLIHTFEGALDVALLLAMGMSICFYLVAAVDMILRQIKRVIRTIKLLLPSNRNDEIKA